MEKNNSKSNSRSSGLSAYKQKTLREENKKRYDDISDNFSECRRRTFIVLAAELSVVAFFLTDVKSLIPDQLYGRILSAGASSVCMFSVLLLLYNYRSIYKWPTPIGPREQEMIKSAKNEEGVDRVVSDDYHNAAEVAHSILERMARILNFSMHAFVICAIILLVIKIFGKEW